MLWRYFPLLSPFETGQPALITAAETIGDFIHKIKGKMPDGSQPKGLNGEDYRTLVKQGTNPLGDKHLYIFVKMLKSDFFKLTIN